MIVISVLIRPLREGKTYAEFREAWLSDQGFGFPTRVVSAQRVDDEREIITIGFSEMDEAAAEAQLHRQSDGGLSRRSRGESDPPPESGVSGSAPEREGLQRDDGGLVG